MLVATFSADTAWSGRRITHEEGRFVLEAFGVISAAQVLEYDRVTPLVWSAGGTRAWVRSVAHREGGAAGAPSAAGSAVGASSAAGAATAAAAGAGPPAAGSSAAPAAQPSSHAPGQAAGPSACRFARAHYVAGQPSLGPALAGPMLVTPLAIALGGTGGVPGPSLSLSDVAKVSLFAGQAFARSGLTAAATAGEVSVGAPGSEVRTFVVAHLRPRGYEAFAVDGLAPDAVREALAPVLGEAGVRLEGRAPSGRPSPMTDEVQRLAVLHAEGALTDDEFRVALGPVLTGQTPARDEERGAASGPRVVPGAAREAALDRLSKLRLSGAISDAELAAMRAKLLE